MSVNKIDGFENFNYLKYGYAVYRREDNESSTPQRHEWFQCSAFIEVEYEGTTYSFEPGYIVVFPTLDPDEWLFYSTMDGFKHLFKITEMRERMPKLPFKTSHLQPLKPIQLQPLEPTPPKPLKSAPPQFTVDETLANIPASFARAKLVSYGEAYWVSDLDGSKHARYFYELAERFFYTSPYSTMLSMTFEAGTVIVCSVANTGSWSHYKDIKSFMSKNEIKTVTHLASCNLGKVADYAGYKAIEPTEYQVHFPAYVNEVVNELDKLNEINAAKRLVDAALDAGDKEEFERLLSTKLANGLSVRSLYKM